MAVGRWSMVTDPLAALTVTGKPEPVGAAPAPPAIGNNNDPSTIATMPRLERTAFMVNLRLLERSQEARHLCFG